mgnify:CR=1 FL=1
MDKNEECPEDFMLNYRDKVMLKQVFCLSENDNNILERPLTEKCLIDKNPPNFGERYRNFKVIQKDGLYYLIVNDTTEIKQ